MLTKLAKICILALVIAPAVLAITTTTTTAATTTTTNELQGDKMKQNSTEEREEKEEERQEKEEEVWPEMQRLATATATPPATSTSTSTATPTTTATTSTTTTTTTTTEAPNGNEAARQISNAVPTTTLTTTTTTTANKLMMSNPKDTLYRIKLSDMAPEISPSTPSSSSASSPSPSDDDEETEALHIQLQAAASYQVAETLADLNDEERERYGAMLAQQPATSKLNIVDLYPMKLEDFQVFKQPADAAEYRQNLMPNEVEMRAVNQPSMASSTSSSSTLRATTVSDFTGKLLAEQDDLITEIERKFQLQETTSTRATPTATTRRPLPQLSPGNSYIDRRVKKSYEFPLHRASDVMAMPHIDFANTKFNTDAEAVAVAAAHPEFSTTKFYNSKELYNEMLLQNKRKLMKTSTTTPPPLPQSVIKSVESAEKSSEPGQVIRTSDPTKLATAATTTRTMTMMTEAASEPEAEAPSTLSTLRRVTLTPTLQSFEAATPTTALPDTPTMTTSMSTPTLPAKKYQQQLKRAKLLLKAILPTATKTPKADLDNLEVVGARVPTTTTTTTTEAVDSTSSSVSPSSSPASTLPRRFLANPAKSASKPIARPRILSRLQEKINSLECEIQNVPQDSHLWRGNETHELLLPIVTTEHCKPNERCLPNVVSWQGEAEIQSGDILIVEINDAMLNPTHEPNNTSSAAHATQVYQVTRSGHEHCDVTEGVLLDITPLVVDGRKLVTLYDKDLTEGVNLLIVVSELWSAQCVRLKVTTKTDNCGENADCSGKGVCYSNVAMEEYECQCCSGFAGPHCEEIDACNPSPCTNNGICVDLSQGHEGNSYQCLCPYGYGGKNCQYESDPCNPAECMNGGSCVGNSTHFRCDCSPGYAGPLCQHSLNECESSPCVHGICVDQEDGFRCFCQPGFAGELCNFEYNECESNPCQNGGECIDHIGSYECRCSKGYTGNRCQIKVDFCANKPCPEGHRCIDHGNDFSCECPGGRNGPDCNQMPRTQLNNTESNLDDNYDNSQYFQQCNVNPCTHGGTCWSSGDSFYCACRPGYTGTMCEDEFVVETVVSSSEFIVDDANARNFNDKTFGSSVVLKSPIELHNAYFAAGVLAAAIFIVAVVVTICHCKVNQTYRKFSTRTTSFIPILGFSRRPKMQGKLNKHWLSGKGLAAGSAASAGVGVGAAAQSTRHLPPCQPNGSSAQTQTTLNERPFQRHLAMNLENDMYYTVDFSENSQHSPLIQ